MRDDNVFLHPPLDINAIINKYLKDKTKNVVILNKFCKWGTINDKTFFLTKKSANLLFGTNYNSWIKAQYMWLSKPYGRGKTKSFMQTEAFLELMLHESNTSIVEMDIYRSELRLVDDMICVAHAYSKCTKAENRNLLKICPLYDWEK